MITEDYVSFETAKLLKEKGFYWECIGYYVDHEPKNVKHSLLGETNSTWESRCCSAPTLQMAMKWLMEVHNLFIQVELYQYTFEGEMKFQLEFFRYGSRLMKKPSMIFSSYEEACEAAIKYCLENLI